MVCSHAFVEHRSIAIVPANWDEERQKEHLRNAGVPDAQASALVDVAPAGMQHALRPYADVEEKVLSVQTTLETALAKAQLQMEKGFRETNWTLHGVGATLVLLSILKNIG
ncbi:hypothetical protein COCOBI_16-4380 [Coccomyxa sp. Obi]|nr:hypothetical protein COCOBI_16-4380 [Coccomyxa sp. Obi]